MSHAKLPGVSALQLLQNQAKADLDMMSEMA
jgi:hypothetical protein